MVLCGGLEADGDKHTSAQSEVDGGTRRLRTFASG